MAWKRNRLLTDKEIARKFGIPANHPHFATARDLAHHRPDRVICDLPDLTCPHCGRDFAAQITNPRKIEPHDRITCPRCRRTIYVEAVDAVSCKAGLMVTLTLITESPK